MGEYVQNHVMPRARDFARFVLKREWSAVHRVRIPPEDRAQPGMHEWCEESAQGRWHVAPGTTVFYFENGTDATFFALKFVGASHHNSNSNSNDSERTNQ